MNQKKKKNIRLAALQLQYTIQNRNTSGALTNDTSIIRMSQVAYSNEKKFPCESMLSKV